MRSRRIKTKHRIVAGVEAELLRKIRSLGGLSRVELAHELQMAPSTAGIYVDRLLRDRFLVEGEKRAERELGRRPTLLLPNPMGGRFVGVDFEARGIMATVIDFSQQVIRQAQSVIREGDSAARVLAKIEGLVREVIQGDERPLLGIGVGMPGTVDPATGMGRGYEFIPGWRDVPLAKHLGEAFGVPVEVENNIRSMAMAELWFGQGRGREHFVCLGVRTGIGVGVVAHGQLLRGAHGTAGQIGKWAVPGGGTFEAVASLKAILARLKLNDFAELRRAVEDGARPVLKVLAQAAQVHAWAVRQLRMLFDPECVILVGPLAELGGALLEPLAAAASDGEAPTEIVNSTLGQFSGAFGAAALAMQAWKPAR